MTVITKNQLFTAAYDQLRMALAFAEGIKDSPTASIDAVYRFNTQVSKAAAATQQFENAMREVTSHPTAQG